MLWTRQQQILKAWERIPKHKKMSSAELRRKLHKEIECTDDEVTYILHSLFAPLIEVSGSGFTIGPAKAQRSQKLRKSF